MAIWRSWRANGATLRYDGVAAVLEGDDSIQRWSKAEIGVDPAAEAAVIQALDLRTWLELTALAQVDGLPASPPRVQRAAVARTRSKRGPEGWSVHILGRTVRVRFSGGETINASLDELAVSSLSADHQARLGAETVAWLARAVAVLQPLACMCHTGARTTGQHGSIRHLTGAQEPMAPVEDYTWVGVCTVCGQWWTFNRAGDSHYSFVERAWAWDPAAG